MTAPAEEPIFPGHSSTSVMLFCEAGDWRVAPGSLAISTHHMLRPRGLRPLQLIRQLREAAARAAPACSAASSRAAARATALLSMPST